MADINKIAADALEHKALDLLKERLNVRRRLLEGAVRDREIEQDIGGCIAGAKALGFEIELPPQPSPATVEKRVALQNFNSARSNLINAYPVLRADYGITEDGEGDEPPESETELEPEMPRVADIIIDRLTAAGDTGAKAAEIRRFILQKYNADIHEKTVGMTLYRLQKAGTVRREGHTWFLSSAFAEKKNPGAATPGLINLE